MIYSDQGGAALMSTVPRGAFNIIYADPAWSFITWGKKRVVPQRADEQHYPVMTKAELLSMPVGEIAAKDAVLIMWITASNLLEGLELARSWGFTYKTKVFTWCKITAPQHAGQFGFYPPEIKTRIGMGHWSRQESEDCYLFTRGKPKRLGKGVRQLIFEPRREHSRKPDGIRERIVALCGDHPRIELFSRTAVAGWSAWGNQVAKFQTR